MVSSFFIDLCVFECPVADFNDLLLLCLLICMVFDGFQWNWIDFVGLSLISINFHRSH